ncbi:hypothetical protein MMC09_000705 [Bachmanniomyces sp. S44760]|nr:hypothetical protein [Bachmanniomyces sp. S44760]
MSFRKRNVGITGSSGHDAASSTASEGDVRLKNVQKIVQYPGVRPSPLDGRPTTSTGTASLDGLLAGHSGLPLGNSVLIEETGTTDYAGTLLRYYAAEGVVQGHKVHVVGSGENWGRELPGVSGANESSDSSGAKGIGDSEKMKIAWRYERLGEFGAGPAASRASIVPSRHPIKSETDARTHAEPSVFCHTFDLTKRLTLPNLDSINFIPISPARPHTLIYRSVIEALSRLLSSSERGAIHRVVIPTLLSPALYPPQASQPKHVLQFLHSLRALSRQYPIQLTVMLTLPLTLYPRATGLVRWLELLCDGVLELTPFPHTVDTGPSITTSGAATSQEDKPQGMLKIHRLPVFHERGGGGAGGLGVGDDLAFTVSRRKFVIKPFSLPPVEGDTEAQTGETSGKQTKIDVDF